MSENCVIGTHECNEKPSNSKVDSIHINDRDMDNYIPKTAIHTSVK